MRIITDDEIKVLKHVQQKSDILEERLTICAAWFNNQAARGVELLVETYGRRSF